MTNTLEPAIDPNNRIVFLLDWELTMKCNLDCSYCPSGTYGGHDNSTKHPPLDECLKSISFMFEYADMHMAKRPQGLKHVVLNIYGGEALHHPHIVSILEEVHNQHKQFQHKWNLVVTTTTNAIVAAHRLEPIIPLIDEFTCSFHAESTAEQQQQFRQNVLAIKNAARRVKCVVLMHSEPEFFKSGTDFINWCNQHDVRYLPRQLDHPKDYPEFDYTEKQIVWFNKFYKTKTYNTELADFKEEPTDIGRACCGGRQLCADQDYKQRHFFVGNRFPDWYCSVNQFFLYVKQVTGEIFTNKDCKMNFAGEVGPIGTLGRSNDLLCTTQQQLDSSTPPVIQCKKTQCLCGLCAPKARTLDDYQTIMKKYQK